MEIGDNAYDITELKGMLIKKIIESGHQYHFTICGTVNGECGYFNCYRVRSFTGCHYENQFVDYCLGSSQEGEEVIREIEIDGKNGLSIFHGGGDQYLEGCWKEEHSRSMRIEILCDESISGMPTDIELIDATCVPEISPTITFRFHHRVGCKICECNKNGKCERDRDGNRYCKCKHPYVGQACSGIRMYNNMSIECDD